MEPRIAILDPEVVNQIAAGEVVERPASVVKELVENALDAGARRIDVEVEQGGRRLVRVADDGCGMTPDEAVLALRRHATSKLRRSEDLQSIRSMGFRGEALPAIASVSRLTLVTRTPDSDVGLSLGVEGGEHGRGEPAGCRAGTTIEVTDLFFNTPARLKFLKSTATETAHVSDVVTQLALGHPAVHFTLAIERRRTLDCPPCSDRLERARQALGRRAGHLFGAGHDAAGVTAHACLGPPQDSTRSSRSVHLLVNRRAVRDRSLVNAVVAGYETMLERGRFPLAVVHVDIDPVLVDVNVHPRKVEVRFSEPARVFAAVRTCVREGLARVEWVRAGGPPAGYEVEASVSDETRGYVEHRLRLEQAARRFWRLSEAGPGEPMSAAPAMGSYFSGLRVVGQVLGTYLVCEGDDELVLIDQQAAHERLIFERLSAARLRGEIPGQGLLIPGEVELDRTQAARAREHDGLLHGLGFELEPFGGASWAVRALPACLAGADPGRLIRDVLEHLAAQGADDAMDGVLACMARHAPVVQTLEPQEVALLLAALDRTDGRPVMLRLSRAELEERSRR